MSLLELLFSIKLDIFYYVSLTISQICIYIYPQLNKRNKYLALFMHIT